MLPKMSAYGKSFGETKNMSLLAKCDRLFEKFDKIWGKVSNSIKKGFDIEPVYNEKHLKTNIKPYQDKIDANFHDDGMPK